MSMSVMQNLLATCCFFMINLCGIKTFFINIKTGIKAFFILSFICYVIDVFSFSFILFPHLKVDSDLATKRLADLLN